MAEMTPNSETTGKRRFLIRLLLLLLLLPAIFGMLLCAGQVALLIGLRYSTVDTSSRIQANYLPWPYNLIPAINVAALIEDLERERAMGGLPIEPTLVLQATFWEPPTAIPGAVSTSAPSQTTTLPPSPPPPPARTATPEPQETTALPPTATRTASSTATRPPFIPTATFTQPPPDDTPTTASTNTPVPSATATLKPTATKPPPTATTGPTRTLPPPPPAATYAPVVPQGEKAEVLTGACRATFGYWNQNPRVVSIPIGPRNNLSEDGLDGQQPDSFVVGGVSGAFSVEWSSGTDLIWSLDGRSAVVDWCNP